MVKLIGTKWENTKASQMFHLMKWFKSSKGMCQALKDVKFDRILSSDLSRALVYS